MLGTSARPEGITNPPIDDLLEKVDSKYGLVVEAAKRARQINTYIRQLEENRFEFFPPLVDTEPEEKPLSIALRVCRGIDCDGLSESYLFGCAFA